ncbi:MAG: DUF58 domain-containing protein [Pegethrix bostrychoides GSE-TBD4-15B]|jgi:uncharacterized protein (DUF58 family)|uniref:DUF58 domain-containing protein n=1 Tax=Pegethrix bostrychoides GSE-TBD4-15B TaxID=2839662 RepID=A0A951U4H9_9CYAN|nr:DUF58 domain-containing protein [Pegethrix bostrychoides GSE-TBD4-15B]
MAPTGRVYGLLLLGLGTAVFSQVTLQQSHALPIMLAWDGAVLLLMLLDSWRVKPSQIAIQRSALERLSIGRGNPVELKLVNQSGKVALLQVQDEFPQAFSALPQQLELKLPANASQTLSYQVLPSQRGDYNFGAIRLRQLGVWGLAWRSWSVPQAQAAAVYPDLVGLKALSIRLALQNTGSLKRAQRLGMGTEFAELREYSIGDDSRLIDWKATSRRSRLLLRVLEPEREQTLILLLDSGRLMTAQVQGLARFDWGMNAVLALALAGLNRGDRVGVGLFDRLLHTWIPPERGQDQLSKIIDRLTPLQPSLQEPDYLGAVTAITQQQARRALVVLITDVIDKTASAELLSAMTRLTPRYLPFCVALRDPQIERQAQGAQPGSSQFGLSQSGLAEAGYQQAVALDLLSQRQIALETLKQKGVLILDASADQLSDQLVERYLQIKRRSQL